MGEFSLTHLLILAVIVLIFFGPSRLPALGQSLGRAIRGFKSGINEIDAEAKPIEDEKSKTANTQSQLKSESTNEHGQNQNAQQVKEKESQKS